MAEFKSQYKELGFYVDGEFYKFQDGRFVSEDEAVISVLNGISDAVRIDKEEPKKVAEEKAPAKPARKPKASGK